MAVHPGGTVARRGLSAAGVVDTRRRRRQPHRTAVRSRGARRRTASFRGTFGGAGVPRARTEGRRIVAIALTGERSAISSSPSTDQTETPGLESPRNWRKLRGCDMRHPLLAGTGLLATLIAFQAFQTPSATGFLSQTARSTS